MHAKKKRRIKRMSTAEDEVIKLQPTISMIPMKRIRPTMNKYGTIFTIINVYVNNTMLFNPYVCCYSFCILFFEINALQ